MEEFMSVTMARAEAAFAKSMREGTDYMFRSNFILGVMKEAGAIEDGPGEHGRIHYCQSVSDYDDCDNMCHQLGSRVIKSLLTDEVVPKCYPKGLYSSTDHMKAGFKRAQFIQEMTDCVLEEVRSLNARNLLFVCGNAFWHEYLTSVHRREGVSRSNSRANSFGMFDAWTINDIATIRSSHVKPHEAWIIDFSKVKLVTEKQEFFIPKRRDDELVGVFSGSWVIPSDGCYQICPAKELELEESEWTS
jgi:hypothetical protein